jgi:hypothetical protein
MTASVLAQLAALKGLPTPDLKRRWRDLFETEPPPYNRRFLESRLSYRIQELAFGGLTSETIERQKGLAFGREQSGTVTVPGTRRASGSCPAGCMAKVGLRWWRRATPHQRDGGSRWQDLPIRNSSFCPRLRNAMTAELNCPRTLKANPPERLSIS